MAQREADLKNLKLQPVEPKSDDDDDDDDTGTPPVISGITHPQYRLSPSTFTPKMSLEEFKKCMSSFTSNSVLKISQLKRVF